MRPDQKDLLARVGDLYGCRRDRAEPLRLRVWLLHGRVPFIGYHGLAEMEGLVQSIAVALAARDVPADLLGGLTDDVVIPSPIEHMTIGGEPIACCSWGIPAEGANKPSVYVLRRRPEYDSFNLARIQTNHGEHKALQVPISILVTPYLDFYVRGDRERIEALRPWMHTLGRGGAFSLGAILQVEITEDAEDRSLAWRNRPQRAIPVTSEGPLRAASFWQDAYELRVQAIRAPYWRPWAPHPLCLVPTPQAFSEASSAALPEAA